MVKKKYTGDHEIRDKIKDLFAYRKLTDLLHLTKLDKDRSFSDHLTDVQYQIYLLDAYLESAWSLEKEKLATHWAQIEHALSQLIPASADVKPLLKEIREYEHIELNCRKNKWPTRERFIKFYTIKSCDVRLMRHLIYMASPDLHKTWKEKAWAWYDLITEVNDDVSDVMEDLPTYNGNRFLISVLKRGSRKTVKQYKAHLFSIRAKAEKYFTRHGKKGNHEQLYTWTLSRLEETISLLDQALEDTDHNAYTTSLLLSSMK